MEHLYPPPLSLCRSLTLSLSLTLSGTDIATGNPYYILAGTVKLFLLLTACCIVPCVVPAIKECLETKPEGSSITDSLNAAKKQSGFDPMAFGMKALEGGWIALGFFLASAIWVFVDWIRVLTNTFPDGNGDTLVWGGLSQ